MSLEPVNVFAGHGRHTITPGAGESQARSAEEAQARSSHENFERAKRLLDLGDAMREKHGEFLWLFERLKDLGMSPDQAGCVACNVIARQPIRI